MRPKEDIERVQALIAEGLSTRAIETQTGIPSSTVRLWRRTGGRGPRREDMPTSWRPADPVAYSYALGLYLGDGHVAFSGQSRRSPFLRMYCDAAHPGIIQEAAAALRHVFAPSAARINPVAGTGCVVVQTSSPVLPLAFPQHGPGRKHLRPIVLDKWQLNLTTEHPRALLRGLIHSDGCRTVNRFQTRLPSGRVAEYEYPRYFFSNLSDDIRRIFCEHCELLGIRWTQSNHRNISVSHRHSVALMDSFIGPKY